MNTMIICTTRGLDYWAETHLPRCIDRKAAQCACADACVCALVFVWAIGTHSSLPRSEKAVIFISRNHWLCIQREFRLCDYNEDVTMDKMLQMQRYFPGWLVKTLEKETKLWAPPCFLLDFTGNRTKAVTWLLSCVPIWPLETSEGTCSALLSERKLANLENSDVKTTSVEQTVPQRHGEWWKEKESTITAYEAHCGQKNGIRERCYRFITLKLNTHTHACALGAQIHTKIPQCWTEVNGEIAGSSRLEMRWESGQGNKELVVLFISLVQSWVGQGWREK